MKLPSVVTPEYKIKTPSGRTLSIRPFLAQEEKILLMAIEDNDKNEESLHDALIQVLTNCVVTPNFDINSLSSIDVDFIFIELRKKSVGEIIELEYETAKIFEDCPTTECPETLKVKFSLNDVEVKNLNPKNIIMLDEKNGIKLKAPTLGATKNITSKKKKTDILFSTIAECIDEIFNDEDSVSANKFNNDELVEWVSKSVGHKQLEEIMDYITSAPYMSKTFKLVCPMCGKEKEVEAKGLSDFFT